MKTSNRFEALSLRTHLEDATEKALHLEWCPFINIIVIGFGLFLLSSKWVCPPGIQVHLPKTENSLAYNSVLPAKDFISVDKDLRIFFNNRFCHLQQISTLLPEAPKQDALVLKADENVSMGYVIKIFEYLRKKGYKTIQIAVDVP